MSIQYIISATTVERCTQSVPLSVFSTAAASSINQNHEPSQHVQNREGDAWIIKTKVVHLNTHYEGLSDGKVQSDHRECTSWSFLLYIAQERRETGKNQTLCAFRLLWKRQGHNHRANFGQPKCIHISFLSPIMCFISSSPAGQTGWTEAAASVST